MYKRKTNKKNGESWQFFCYGKCSQTRSRKQYQRTYTIPANIIGKVKLTEKYLAKCEVEFQDYVDNVSKGAVPKITKKLFKDFATDWVEKILENNPQGFHYYRRCTDSLEVINEKLGSFYLHELNQFIIYDFCKWLIARKYKKQTVTVKQSLKENIKARSRSLRSVADSCSLSDCTLTLALKEGEKVSYRTAVALCKHLNVNIEKYYDIQEQEFKYAVSTNSGIKTILYAILREAYLSGYIECNYASQELIGKMSGRAKSKKIIYDSKESIQEFNRCIDTEPDPRKRIVCGLFLFLGLRSCEAAGLEWKDFKFNISEDSEVTICRNSIYVSGFKTQTKDTKTENSVRNLIIPRRLYFLLLNYKDWWANEKVKHGDLWAKTDRLFVQCNGNNVAGMTLSVLLREFQDRNNLRRVSPHGMRHTNITLQSLIGVPAKAIQSRAGHSDITTTLNIYTHGTKEADKQAARMIDGYFN